MRKQPKPKAIIPDPAPERKLPRASANGTSILTEALRLHDRGFWIVSCDGKKPHVKDWEKRRMTGGELSVCLRGTRQNIGIVLNQSGLIDVECDSEEAEAALQVMFATEIQPTPTWQSKRGLHRLFRRPSDMPDKAKLEINGVEFRGLSTEKGAVSILPPSVHPDGHKYEWLPGLSIYDVDPAELPASIVDRLRSPEPQVEPAAEEDIPEGKRNDALFKMACKLRKAGLDASAVDTALLILNTSRCKPPLPDEEVRAIAKSASERSKQGQTIAERLLELATTDVDYWHTPEGTAFATIRRDGHQEHWRVRSSAFKQWLARQFYEAEKTAVGSQTMADVLNVLEARACFDGEEHPTFLRLAGHDGRIYLDLADDSWRAIEIDTDGWRIVAEAPVRFRRAKGMLPIPEPKQGGSVEELRQFVNVTNDDWPLLLGWQIAALRPSGPYPILKLLGEQGSAKTTTAEILRKLIDPNAALLRRPPKSERDLMIAANNGWVIAFDNLSYVTPDLSDALCSLATGGGFATRTLYSDDDETILVAERPILLNGIEDPGIRSDLVDRSLAVVLPVIEPDKRKAEDDFWREFDEACPRILGSLLDAVAVVLRELPNVKRKGEQLPRMADFAQWATAAETALGFAPGTFLNAYADNRQNANQAVLESSPVVKAIWDRLKMRNGKLTGTATELLNELSHCQDTKVKGWPKTPRVLSGVLSRLAPNLRLAGLSVEQGWRGKEKIWLITAPTAPVDARLDSATNLAPVAPVATVTHGNKAKPTVATPKPTVATPKPTVATPEQGDRAKTSAKQGKL